MAALGFRRENNFIDWDDDVVDIAIWKKDKNKLCDFTNEFKKNGFFYDGKGIYGLIIVPNNLDRKGEKIDIDITGKNTICIANGKPNANELLDCSNEFDKINI